LCLFDPESNDIKGSCSADRELTSDEVYPGRGYIAVAVEDEDIVSKFMMYEFDGVGFKLKSVLPGEHVHQTSETEILGQQIVEKDLQILDLQQENQVLGQQLVDIDLRLLMGGM